VTATPSETTAVIAWKTDEVSKTRVNYAVGSLTDHQLLASNRSDAEFVTTHGITLTNLLPFHTYTFDVASVDPSANLGIAPSCGTSETAPPCAAGDLFTFTTTDTTPPVITISGNATGEAEDAGGRLKANTTLPTVTATDNSQLAVTITDNAPAKFPLGVTTVTVTATDAAGKSATKTYTVTISDSKGPELVCPADVTIAANGPLGAENFGVAEATSQALVAFLGGATATDLVDLPADVTITNNAPPMLAAGAVTTVTFTAKDKRLNASTCTAKVTVTGEAPAPPALACPAGVSLSGGAGTRLDWSAAFRHPVSVGLEVMSGGGGGNPLVLTDLGGSAVQLAGAPVTAPTQYGVRLRVTDLATGVLTECNTFLNVAP
jgi:hypothetical protein